MEQTESTGISRRRLLAMSSISAVAMLLGGLGRFTSSGYAKASDLLTTTFRTNTLIAVMWKTAWATSLVK
jgi:hypothetical protein